MTSLQSTNTLKSLPYNPLPAPHDYTLKNVSTLGLHLHT